MNQNEFLIRFGGESHIRVETLTDFLDNYRKLLYGINAQLGHSDKDLIVEVSPPENGSFKIRLSPKYESQILGTISGIVAGTLSGLLLAWILSSDKKLTIEDVQKLVEKMQPDQKTEIVTNVYNTFQKVEVKQTLNKTFQIINKDGNIESLDVSQNDKGIISIPRTDFNKYVKPEADLVEDIVETEKTDIEEVALIVKTIHFEGSAKWGFIWRGYPIKASIKDEEFLSKLNSEAFKRGDILSVRLQKRSIFNEDLKTYIVDDRSYEIVEVLDHKSRNSDDHIEFAMDSD